MKILAKALLVLYILSYSLLLAIPVYIFKGDVNMDGQVNALDCITINRIINNTLDYSLIQYINADIDVNGTINQDDIELLSQEIIWKTKEILLHGSTETNTVSN